MPVVAPGESATSPLLMTVPTAPELVMAVPPRRAKSSAERRMDASSVEVQNSAAQAATAYESRPATFIEPECASSGTFPAMGC